jgi:signal transduction histidine kinase
MRGEIEVALKKERQNEEYKKVLKSLLEEINKLQKIIDNLLFLARIESKNIKLSFEKVQLDEILLEAFEEIETLAKRKKISLILKRVDQASVEGDETLIKRLFVNLIDNAIKYTHEDGKVEISLTKERNFAKFIIKDTGIGIPENEIPYIFDRFYRVEKARSRETGGSGLGLAIAKWIVEAHKGKIEVRSKVSEGSLFAISFPIDTPSNQD